jgi:hypothetical protein
MTSSLLSVAASALLTRAKKACASGEFATVSVGPRDTSGSSQSSVMIGRSSRSSLVESRCRVSQSSVSSPMRTWATPMRSRSLGRMVWIGSGVSTIAPRLVTYSTGDVGAVRLRPGRLERIDLAGAKAHRRGHQPHRRLAGREQRRDNHCRQERQPSAGGAANSTIGG